MTIAHVDHREVSEGPAFSVHKAGRPGARRRGRALGLLRGLLVVVLVAMAILLLLPAALAAQAAVAV